MRSFALLLFLGVILAACSEQQSMTTNFVYTQNLQYVHFRPDQTEERGPVEADAAVEAFRGFPFEEQQQKARTLPQPTFPTISFRSQPDGAVLAIWSLAPGEYEIYMEAAGEKVTAEESNVERVEQIIRDFFAGQRAQLSAELSEPNGAVVRRGFLSRIKGILGLR